MTDNIPKEFKDEVRKQATQQAAKWMIVLVLFLAGIALSGWWLYLHPKIDNYIMDRATGIPAGAIIAFAGSETQPCPGEDWVLFEEVKGRFIVGAGHADRSKLTPRKVGDIGGFEKVKLTE